MSSGTQIGAVITHGCKNLEEKKNKVAGEDDQKVDGGVLADLDEKARRTTNSGKASVVTFRGIYDDKQRQDVFDAGGIGCRGIYSGWQKERTVHQRKHEVNLLIVFPFWEDAGLILI